MKTDDKKKEIGMVDGKQNLSRRRFLKASVAGAMTVVSSHLGSAVRASQSAGLRLGGPVFQKYQDPDGWVQAVRRLGYRAAYCPVGADASDDVVQAYERAAREADIIIAEVGAWSNPISPDEKTRTAAREKCRRQLAMADRIGARCCVNITGSRGAQWDGPDAKNLTEETFEMIVQTTRAIIDVIL
jgi:sugar phosphate isomerase/epimerase